MLGMRTLLLDIQDGQDGWPNNAKLIVRQDEASLETTFPRYQGCLF